MLGLGLAVSGLLNSSGMRALLSSSASIAAKAASPIKSLLASTASALAKMASPIKSVLSSTAAIAATINSPASGNDSFTTVLLHMDGSDDGTVFTDSNVGGSAHTWTAHGNCKTKTTQSKFGGASCRNSIASSAAGDYLSTPDHADWHMGSGDFTIDCWFRRGGNLSNYNVLFWWGAGSNLRAYIDSSDHLDINVAVGGGVGITGSTAISDTTTWHHFALVRSGNTFKMFLDGVQEGSTQTVSGSLATDAAAFIIGNYSDASSYPFNGFIDEFRISKGIARWTSNFTPPSAPYA